MIYPPAPDIWLCEVLFRQWKGVSALRRSQAWGLGRGETQGQPSLADLVAAVGCRAFPRRFCAPSRCLSAMPADQSAWINSASKARPV